MPAKTPRAPAADRCLPAVNFDTYLFKHSAIADRIKRESARELTRQIKKTKREMEQDFLSMWLSDPLLPSEEY